MKRIEKLILDGNYECCMLDNTLAFKGVPIYSDGCEIAKWFLEELPEPQKLTPAEYELAKFVLKEGSKWLARDAYGDLYIYDTEPVKSTYQWMGGEPAQPLYGVLYQFVKWEDEEPTNLQELIDNCEVVEGMKL